MITTMYRDIEIDLLHTDALKRLLEVKASPKKWHDEKDIIDQILKNLSEISFTRSYSALFQKNWDFKRIDLRNYVDNIGEVNYVKLINAFCQNNRITKPEWSQFLEWKESQTIDLKSITRGHDATCILGQMLRGRLGNRDFKETSYEIIEEDLRLAVQTKFVEPYPWFKDISDWA